MRAPRRIGNARRAPAVAIAAVALMLSASACGGSSSSSSSTSSGAAATTSTASAAATRGGGKQASRANSRHRPQSSAASRHNAGTAHYRDPLLPFAHRVAVTERLRTISNGGGVVVQAGTVNGPPTGAGTIHLRAHIAASGALVEFIVHTATGTVRGVAGTRIKVNGSRIVYTGVARVLHGTGRFARLRPSSLALNGTGDLLALHTVIHLSGHEWY